MSRYAGSGAESSWKATAAVEVNGLLKISGFKIIRGKNGHFGSLPAVRSKNGFFLQLVNPATPEFKQFLQDELLKLYLETLEEGRDDAEAEEVVKTLMAGAPHAG
jgi:DNA-binding cell septation regulator SpoVG